MQSSPETFYNSLYRNITGDAPVNDNEMFVWPVIHEPADPNRRSLVRVYRPTQGVVQMIRDVFNDLPLERPWQNLERDIGNVLRSLMDERPEILTVQGLKLEILKPIFLSQQRCVPDRPTVLLRCELAVALPFLLDDARHIYVDTLICDPDELSIVFSFTRAYFIGGRKPTGRAGALPERPAAKQDALRTLCNDWACTSMAKPSSTAAFWITFQKARTALRSLRVRRVSLWRYSCCRRTGRCSR